MRLVACVLDPEGFLASRLNQRYLGQPGRLIGLFRLLSLEKEGFGVGQQASLAARGTVSGASNLVKNPPVCQNIQVQLENFYG